jgi:WD40 repeat protein
MGLRGVSGCEGALSRLFISHSSRDSVSAKAFKQWLGRHGWSDEDVFLDLDDIGAGERWKEALRKASARCEAVILLASPEALSSAECLAEVRKAEDYGKEIIVVLLRDLTIEDHRLDSYRERQIADLTGQPLSHVETIDYRGETQDVRFNPAGLARVKDYLFKCGITPDRFAWPPNDRPNAEPYPGLSAFGEGDAGIFFGRDTDILRGLDKIRLMRRNGRPRFLVIQAASGSGKSSYLRAGLWPRLERDLDFAPLAIVRPAKGILTGPQGLGRKLAERLSRPGAPVLAGDIHARLMAADASKAADEFMKLAVMAAAQALEQRRIGDQKARAPALTLAIDQAEELFAPENEEESSRFLFLVANLINNPPPDVEPFGLLTIRSDSAARLFQAIDDEGLEAPDTLPLLPLPQTAYRDIILKPLEVIAQRGQRLLVESALADRLVNDATGADALPLLAFTLSHLYQNFGAAGSITLAQYEAMGGVAGSIDMALNQALARPHDEPAIPANKEEQLAVLRAAFIPWLARVDPETNAPLRRVARLDEFHGHSHAMVERLIEARLLVADRRAGIDVIEVAHESLLRRWPALTAWLESDVENLKLIEAVDRAAGEWARSGQLDAWLDHRAERLEAAELLASRQDFRERIGNNGLAYLAACRTREEAERKDKEAALAREQARLAEIAAAQEKIAAEQARTARVQRTARWTLVAAGVAVVAGIVFGIWQHETNLQQKAALDRQQINLLAEVADAQLLNGHFDSALRLAIEDARLDRPASPGTYSPALAELAAAFFQSGWRLTLSGHTGGVWSASYNADGNRIVTASYDKTARIWDSATGKSLTILRGHQDWVMSAVFSPDGKRVVTASRDRTARIWDAMTGQQLTLLSGHQDVVVSAAFSPDGTRVVTASYDKTARIWDTATGKQLAVLSGHDGGVWKAAFSPDGTQIVTASQDNTARIWNAATATQVAVLSGHEGGVWDAQFSPDGKRIVTASEDTSAIIWDVATAKPIGQPLKGHEDVVLTAAFNSAGTLIVTAAQDGTARLWDGETGEKVTTLSGHEGGVLSAAFSPDGAHIVTASYDTTARIWDTASGNKLLVLPGQSSMWNAAFSPDGNRIVTSSQDKTAKIWDVATGQTLVTLSGHRGWVLWGGFSPDGTRVVTASADGSARVWNAASGKPLLTLSGHQDQVVQASFSPDGSRIVTASYDNTARIWNAATGEQMVVMSGHEGGLMTAIFSPDGAQIITSSFDETARIWDAATGKEIRALRGHQGGVWDAEFSPDGKRIVTASEDRTVRIWEAATGREIVVLRGHENWVWTAVFDADGSRILSASQDHTARLWDATSGVETAIFRDVQSSLYSAAFNPNGTEIVTADEKGSALVWDANVPKRTAQDLIAESCTARLGGLTKLTRDEMQLAGFPDTAQPIDVCAGLAAASSPESASGMTGTLPHAAQ